ncbi:hypothetical protein [Verrucomicrobium sp. BvORR034]|jgi:hypothetical protein|uniref:type IV pilus modification PilV family protein n=1 Tax=Verrucomicrobium sp. BvORR034 TaxID=1396418 RepID=UPI0006798CBD|nr:hypothetical protein [Verrucomicrobium sp. BvORR034]
MKSRPPLIVRRHAAAFTLLEALMALMVFSTAVVSLVAAINGIGTAWNDMREDLVVQTRLESLLVEATRKPDPNQPMGHIAPGERKVQENGVAYLVKIEPLELSNKEGHELPQLMRVRAIARWNDGGRDREETAETWMWPPLFAPNLQQP